MDAACLAREAIALPVGCTHGCSMLRTKCHRYDQGLESGCSMLGRDAIAVLVCCTQRCSEREPIANIFSCTCGFQRACGTRCHRHNLRLHARCSVPGTRCHRYDLGLHAQVQHAWYEMPLPNLWLHTRMQHSRTGRHRRSWAVRTDAAGLARVAIATMLGCTIGSGMLGTICHRCTCGLHARMQHASLVIPSLLSSAARTDAACLARDAIATTMDSTHKCSLCSSRCHYYDVRLHAQMQYVWHKSP